MQEVGAQILEDFGKIDILVNNAGVTRDRLAMRMSIEDWDTVINTNLRGAFNFTQAIVRAMIKQRSGRIINITSVIGLIGNAGQTNYAASKAGLIGFTKSLARELASRSITVNAVAPGFVVTDMTGALSEEVQKSIIGRIPLGRVGEPQEKFHSPVSVDRTTSQTLSRFLRPRKQITSPARCSASTAEW